MVSLGPKDSGAITIPFVITVTGILMLVVKLSSDRAKKEFASEYHNALRVDKMQIKHALRTIKECPQEVAKPCSPGQSINVFDTDGEILVSADGTSKIARWNVKIECSEAKGNQYWVYTSRLAGSGFAKDPLTDRPDDWKPLTQFDCGKKTNVLVQANVCYGLIQGTATLPSGFVIPESNMGLLNRYCSDEQIPFLDCPEGYSADYRIIDRFGWAGMDLTKYTYCEADL